MKNAISLVAVLAAFAMPAVAAETATVQNLLAQDFVVVGTLWTGQVGPGLFLQKKDKLFVCFVSETSASPVVTTRYCKPVQ